MAIAAIQAKHKNNLLSLWEMIEKFLLLKKLFFAASSSDFDASPKVLPSNDSLPKALIER